MDLGRRRWSFTMDYHSEVYLWDMIPGIADGVNVWLI
jgi:hypothetical protein